MVEQYYQHCPQCGAGGGGDLRYCRNCGASLEIPPYLPAYPPPRTKRRSKTLFVIIGAALLLLLTASIIAALVMHNQVIYLPPNHVLCLPPKVVFGPALAWRTISWTPNPNMASQQFLPGIEFRYASLVIGDFDGDQDDEIYLDDIVGSDLIELDGTGKFLNHQFPSAQCGLYPWDYNQDGKDELFGYSTGSIGADVIDMQGTVLASFQGTALPQATALGDFDADGKTDVALLDFGSDHYVMYAPGGSQIWDKQLAPMSTYPTYGDVDGDGRTELIVCDFSNFNNPGNLYICGLVNPGQLVPNWPTDFFPTSVIDLDHDSKGEVFISNYGYLNLATGKQTLLRYGQSGNLRSTETESAVWLVHLPAFKAPCLATIGLNKYNMDSELFLFDISGTCIYEERCGSPVEALRVARKADGSEFLVLLTWHKLLIYP
jgi:hypothetical protein